MRPLCKMAEKSAHIRPIRRIAAALALNLCLGLFTTAWPSACQVTAAALSFGGYDPLASTPKEASSQLNIRCSHKIDAPANVLVSISAGTSGSAAERWMTGSTAGANLFYNLYANPGMTIVIGDGSAGSETLTNTVHKSAPWAIMIYGRIPALQNIPTGLYSDSLTVSIFY